MTDLTAQVFTRIKEHQIEGLPLDEAMQPPFYDGFSLVNIPGSIAQLLDVPAFGKPPLDDLIIGALAGSYEKIILLLVDALGYQLLTQMMQRENSLPWGRYADSAVYCPLTSVCPSTTASALTALWTGQSPAAHGIIGYEMWAKEYGMIINNILHSPASARRDVGGLYRSGFDPQDFLGMPLLGTHFQSHGVQATAFIHSSIAYSGLSVMQMADVDINTFVNEADLCVSLADYINSRKGIREYIYVYYSDIDTLMHRYNAANTRVTLQFDAFSNLFADAFLDKLTRSVAKNTLLILTADHGSMATPINPRYDLNHHPKLLADLVMQPTCEHRLAFLYVKPGRERSVKAYFSKTWADDFILLDSEEVLETGLYGKGPFNDQIRERIGNMVAMARRDAYLWWAPVPNHMQGRHGGLSQQEMIVPFYALPLDALESE